MRSAGSVQAVAGAAAEIAWMRNEKKMNASGASMTTHFSGVPKIGW